MYEAPVRTQTPIVPNLLAISQLERSILAMIIKAIAKFYQIELTIGAKPHPRSLDRYVVICLLRIKYGSIRRDAVSKKPSPTNPERKNLERNS